MKEPFIIKLAAFGGSLVGYYLARANDRDTIPLMMFGGFIAGCAADWLIPTPEEKK